MSNEIRSIASVQGLFNRNSIDIYNENDLMKPVGKDMYGDTWYTIEEFEVRENVQGRYAIGMCVNSYPFFCRYDLCEYGDGTPRLTWLEELNRDSSITGQMKDVAKYDRICPKCGWGVSAYLAIRCKYDERFGVCYYDRNGNETNQRTTFKAYLGICRTIYKAIHQDEYRHYTAIGDVEAVNRLEADFISQHRQAEEHNRNISGEVDRLFFAGQLDSVIVAYLEYVQNWSDSEEWKIKPIYEPTATLKLLLYQDEETIKEFVSMLTGTKKLDTAKRIGEYVDTLLKSKRMRDLHGDRTLIWKEIKEIRSDMTDSQQSSFKQGITTPQCK